jgi:membrane-bound ClpP family serine protease
MLIFLVEGTPLASGPVGLLIALIVIGLVALAIELFILPGFGVAGIIGLALLIGGAVLAWTAYGAFYGGLFMAIIAILAIGLGFFILRSNAVKKRFVLDTRLEKGGGTDSSDLSNFIGLNGETRTDLRPAGIAIIDNQRIDVVSEGGFIEKGTDIRVVAVDGPRVIVARNN